ncbi:hypothetical protein BDR07DRAFT_1382348 [Suillus spraguei]|nr:hypothetical protein BDR07DRAFT_1382348 [Suillus spraguei]
MCRDPGLGTRNLNWVSCRATQASHPAFHILQDNLSAIKAISRDHLLLPELAESKDMKVVICEENVWINASRRLGGIGAIQELPIVLGQISEDLVVLTGGWHYTIIMEGPDPMSQGDIMTLSFHHGKGQDGLSFKASNPNFHEQYLAPFEQHLRTVFGRPLAESSLSSSIPKPPLLEPSNSTSPNAQNNSAVEPTSSVQANSDLNAGLSNGPQFSSCCG